ncbi:uncharacterized protein BXZ73DRAFT_89218 [Epithele typhae]|uniref:uncharacterized protein n=1 Tax=Epithele typhae TaxID=378194 RepID=UPI002008B627|nr:uncharacterized protein BXZ73DRAFT_89218 [Epithele typhae]KAH9937762.1 hypothetical protein BXZ73DRAFT_89218 [Epithele typhae]
MRSFAVLAFVAAASAVSMRSPLTGRQSLPDCSVSCFTDADLGSCDITDNACLCKSSSYVSSVTSCIESACSGDDIQTAEASASAICLAVGVTLTSPATSSGTSPTTSGTSPVTSGTSPVTSGTSPATSGTSHSASGSTTPSSTSPSSSGTAKPNAASAHGVNVLAALAAVGVAACAF